MATLVKFSDGTSFMTYSKERQDETFNVVSQKVWDEKTPFFTPVDKIKYFILSEKQITSSKFETLIKVGKKEILVKHSDLNQDIKINKAVRNA